MDVFLVIPYISEFFTFQVECIRLIGIFLVLYKKTGSNFKIHNVHGAFVPTGFLKFGNKGGVGISLMLNDTALCFVNSHLAAGSSELYRRNQVGYSSL
jgi:phosphatidylinositol-bisphosphatase